MTVIKKREIILACKILGDFVNAVMSIGVMEGGMAKSPTLAQEGVLFT